MPNPQYIWLDGKYAKFQDAKVHILTHSLQYGSGIFEGIRCYDTTKGPAIFRLREHTKRFFHTAHTYKMPLKLSMKEFEQAVIGIIIKNKLKSAYIRPFGYYKEYGIGFSTKGKTTSVAIAAMDFGPLFGKDQKGLNCMVSSWLRINSSILPASAKVSGNYINSILASQEANAAGYDEAILMSSLGTVAEGPGENIFVVQDNILITPPKSANILLGITRDSIIKIAESIGLEVVERDLRREELYTSDEVFFSGTAAEVVPIISIDSRTVGAGKPGPITKMLQDRYTKVTHGEDTMFTDWLTFIQG